MNSLEWMQLVSNLGFVYIIGFPVVLMASKAGEWERKSGQDYKLRVYISMFTAMVVSSILLFDRIHLTAAVVLFALAPLLMLFRCHIEKYEPSLGLLQMLKSSKVLVVLLLLLLILSPVMINLIADELANTHDQLVERYLENPNNLSEYNMYVLSNNHERLQDYYEAFEPGSLKIQQKGMSFMVLADMSWQSNVLFFYRLDKLRWKLEGVLIEGDESMDQ